MKEEGGYRHLMNQTVKFNYTLVEFIIYFACTIAILRNVLFSRKGN